MNLLRFVVPSQLKARRDVLRELALCLTLGFVALARGDQLKKFLRPGIAGPAHPNARAATRELGPEALSAFRGNSSQPTPANTRQKFEARINAAYGVLPLSFEANQGQTDPRVKFLSRSPGYTLFLASDEAVLALREGDAESGFHRRNSQVEGERDLAPLVPSKAGAPWALFGRGGDIEKWKGEKTEPTGQHAQSSSPESRTSSILRIKLVDANQQAKVAGLEELPGNSNYFIGNVPKQWRVNVPTYARVEYRDIYPGVDLAYYGNQRQLEYDFVVAPGADPKAIRIAFDGVVGSGGEPPLEIDAGGDLVHHTEGGEVRFHKPVVYQEGAAIFHSKETGARRSPLPDTAGKHFIDGRYVLRGNHEVGFQVAAYDPSKPLIIDPSISYSTFLGGNSQDIGYSIAIDSSGNAYVTGLTGSTNFPTATPFQSASGGDADAFVAKLNPAGSTLVYSTYLGGNSFDKGLGIAVNTSGNAYVTGYTTSSNFPTTSGVFQTAYGGNGDAFLTELDPTGSKLVFSSYLGGSDVEFGQGIALDASGNAYVTGSTASTNFPTANPLQASNAGASDAFVTKVNPSGSALVYSTYLGGGDADSSQGIAVDSSGNAYVTGNTLSTNYPTANPLQAASGGSLDAFITKLNAAGSALVYSTYLGGSGFDSGMGVALDSSANACVTGYTSSTNFPAVTPLQATYGGGTYDAFVLKLNSSGSALLFSTYLGGSDADQGFSIGVDGSGNVYLTGYTQSDNFPTANPVQSTFGGGMCGTAPCSDVFVTALNAGGSSLIYSTYLGGSGADSGQGIKVDAAGNVYVTGSAGSSNFPVTAGAVQPAFNGPVSSSDAFVTKIAAADVPSVTLSPQSLNFGNQATGTTSAPQTVTLSNSGSAALAISSIVASAPFAQTNTCDGSVAPGGATCAIDVTFSPTATGNSAGTLTITDDAPGSPHAVKLMGMGVKPAPAVTFSPTSLDFGNQIFGIASPPQTVTLTNSGSAVLSITKIATAADYAETNACPSSLNAGASCTISVTFTPMGTGERLGDLTASDSAAGSPQRVSLTGNGLPVFTLASKPTSVILNGGVDSTTFTISATAPSTFTSTIRLGCASTGQAACAFNPTSFKAGQTSTLTVTKLTSLFSDSLNFTVTGTSGSQTANLPLTITIKDFSLFAFPPSHTIQRGQSTTYTINITPVNGFTGALSFSCSGGPTDLACTISPNSVMVQGSSTSTVTVTAASKASSVVPPASRRRPGLPRFFWLLSFALLPILWKILRRHVPTFAASVGAIILCLVLFSASCNDFFVPVILSGGEGTFQLHITAKSVMLSRIANVTITIT